MKKTLLSLLVASVAGNAFAGDIYSTDTTKVAVSGEVDGYLATTDINGTKTDADVNMWAKVQMDLEQKLSDELTGFASFEIEAGSWYDGTDADARFDDVLIGIKAENWGVAMGEVGDLAGSADAIEKDDITNEGNYMGSAGGNHRESAGKGFVAKAKFGPMVFVADVNTVADTDTDHTYGVSADFQHDLFTLGASYITGEVAAKDAVHSINPANGNPLVTPATAGSDYEKMGISASTEFAGVYLAATYTDFEGVNGFGFYKSDELTKGNAVGVAASYSINNARVYTTYSMADVEKMAGSDEGDTSNWVIGADYAITNNILAFAEYQQAEADWEAKDSMTVVTGVYYAF